MKENKLITIASSMFVFGIVVRFFFVPSLAVMPVEQITEQTLKNPFSDFSLSHAKSVYVYDPISQEVLFAQNAEEVLPLASLTKVMTVLAAADVLAPEETVMISKESTAVRGGGEFKAGESWKFSDLAALTLVASLNDGAVALSENAGRILSSSGGLGGNSEDFRRMFVGLMNQKAETLGLDSLSFSNESGLDQSASLSGAYGNAEDIAKLFAYGALNYPEFFSVTHAPSAQAKSLSSRVLSVLNTNTGLAALPGVLMSKTGTTPLAGANLGLVFDVGVNHPVVAVILGDTEESRFADMEELVRRTKTYFSTRRY